jgi:hypothetical protein
MGTRAPSFDAFLMLLRISNLPKGHAMTEACIRRLLTPLPLSLHNELHALRQAQSTLRRVLQPFTTTVDQDVLLLYSDALYVAWMSASTADSEHAELVDAALTTELQHHRLSNSRRHAIHVRLEEKLLLHTYIQLLRMRWAQILEDERALGVPFLQQPPRSLEEADICQA